MVIEGDKIIFDIWIDYSSYQKIKDNLKDLIEDQIVIRERLHVLKLDYKNYSYKVHEHFFERKYHIEITCLILKKQKKKQKKKKEKS